MAVASDDITIAFASGSGRFESMSLYLARSINRYTPYDSIAFIPASEADGVTREGLRELRAATTDVVIGETSIPEYGQSAKIDALVAAAERYAPPYILVDTDVLFLSEVGFSPEDADVSAKPVDLAVQYWGQEDAANDWERLYAANGFESPTERIESTVDGREIYPYYNAGVVATSVAEFPARWRALTESVHSSIDQAFYADQVALSMLMTSFECNELRERDNYPAPLRLRFPPGICVLHYHYPDVISRLQFSRYRDVIREVGARHDRIPTREQVDESLQSLKRVYGYRVERQIRRELRIRLSDRTIKNIRKHVFQR